MGKSFEVKSKTGSRSTTRWSIPDHLVKSLDGLADALGTRSVDIIEQLVRYNPGDDFVIVGKGGFEISLSVSIYALSESDLELIARARLGDEASDEEVREVKSKDNVSIEETETEGMGRNASIRNVRDRVTHKPAEIEEEPDLSDLISESDSKERNE